MQSNIPDEGERTKVFISYSRKDIYFVDVLVAALEARGYTVLIDRSAIEKGELWWQRIVDLIIECHIVVFIISPASLLSPICVKEIEHTLAMGKRIAPVMFRAAPDIPVNIELKERDWVDFSSLGHAYEPTAQALAALDAIETRKLFKPSRTRANEKVQACAAAFLRRLDEWKEFNARLDELQRAIELDDIIWIREQSRWLQRASAWEEAGKPDGNLMRNAEVTAMQTWLLRRPPTALPVPKVAIHFLDASLNKERRDLDARRRLIQRSFVEAVKRSAQSDAAVRLTAAGAVLSEDPEFSLEASTPEPHRHSLWRAGAPRFIGPLLSVYRRHTQPVHQVCFFPDGKRFLTIATESVANVVDSFTLITLVELKIPDGVISCAAISPDGQQIITIAGHTAYVWAASDGQMRYRLPQHRAELTQAVFSRDGSEILTTRIDGTASRWCSRTGNELQTFCQLPKNVLSIQPSPDGRFVLAAGNSRHMADEISVWNLGEHKQVALCDHKSGGFGHVFCAKFSDSGRLLLTTATDGIVRVWNPLTGEEVQQIQSDRKGATISASFSPDEQRIAAGGVDGVVRILDVASGKVLLAAGGHEDAIRHLAFSGDGKFVASASNDCTARIWDSAATIITARFRAGDDDILAIGLDSTSSQMVIGSKNCKAYIVDLVTGALKSELIGHQGPVTSALLTPDGSFAVTGSKDQSARVWNSKSGQLIHAYNCHKTAVNSIAIDSTGSIAASGDDGGVLRVWSVASGRDVRTVQAHATRITSVRFSCDDTLLLTSSDDCSCAVWNIADGAMIQQINTKYAVECACLNIRAGKIVTLTHDNAIRIWSLSSGELLLEIEGPHGDWARSIDLSANGGLLVSCGDDSSIRLWDAERGAEIRKIALGGSWIKCVRFDGSGSIVAAGQEDGIVSAFDVIRESIFYGSVVTSLLGCLSNGLGMRSDCESQNLLLLDAPIDLYGNLLALQLPLSESATDVPAGLTRDVGLKAEIQKKSMLFRNGRNALCYRSSHEVGLDLHKVLAMRAAHGPIKAKDIFDAIKPTEIDDDIANSYLSSEEFASQIPEWLKGSGVAIDGRSQEEQRAIARIIVSVIMSRTLLYRKMERRAKLSIDGLDVDERAVMKAFEIACETMEFEDEGFYKQFEASLVASNVHPVSIEHILRPYKVTG